GIALATTPSEAAAAADHRVSKPLLSRVSPAARVRLSLVGVLELHRRFDRQPTPLAGILESGTIPMTGNKTHDLKPCLASRIGSHSSPGDWTPGQPFTRW